MGRGTRDALLELEVGRADVAEIGLGDIRRAARVAQSMPVELLALVMAPSIPPEQREALALSIDRASIHQVLLQRQGVISGALLPQWLSGYAHLFSTARDLPRARQLARAAPMAAGYDPTDPAAKAIADRIAVNAREAGLSLRAGGENAPVRLARVRAASPDPAQALAAMAQAFGLDFAGASGSAAALYAAEKAMLEDYRVIPLVHLPDSYALGRQVRNWRVTAWGGWDPANVWLSAEKKP
jgi:ABC-type transport system substrate-binding protein